MVTAALLWAAWGCWEWGGKLVSLTNLLLVLLLFLLVVYVIAQLNPDAGQLTHLIYVIMLVVIVLWLIRVLLSGPLVFP